MPSDIELLRSYLEERSDPAFAELVRRHVDLVYGVALRQVHGDSHLAEDVSQVVFSHLAKSAAQLAGHQMIEGWLFRATQFSAIDAVRTEARRRNREQEAYAMHQLLDPLDPGWEKARPLIDRAIGELNEADRDAVLLRFFGGCSFADIAARLQLTENTARMRVDRALDKLHAWLTRHGITSTTTALSSALAAQTSAAAPAGLAAAISGTALAGATGAGAGAGTTGALAAGTISFMSTAKTTTVIAAIVAIAAIGFGIAQRARSQAAAKESAALRQERDALATQLVRAEQRPQPAEAPAPAAPAAALQPQPAAAPAVPAAPPPTLEATKQALATVNSSTGTSDLDKAHVANVRALVEQDAPGLLRWIATLPTPRQREHTLEAILEIETETDPELAFLLTSGIERELPRGSRRRTVIRAWAARDPDAATRAVATADLPESERERLTQLILISALGRKR